MRFPRLLDAVLGPQPGKVAGSARRRAAAARVLPAPVRRGRQGRREGRPEPGLEPRSARRWGYAPRADGRPDPGEVVWAWVPFEEDASQGKDRPVLVVGTEGQHLLALPLTSQDHDRDAAQEAHAGRTWMDVGTGAWDRRRRPSEVRLDRVLRLEPADVRREGAALDRATFDAVLAAARPFLDR